MFPQHVKKASSSGLDGFCQRELDSIPLIGHERYGNANVDDDKLLTGCLLDLFLYSGFDDFPRGL